MMNYKGYIGRVEYDDENHVFTGNVINTRTVITFQGSTVDEIENEFRASVEDYLEWCREDGVEPEKPYSGKFNVRFSPELHQQAALGAKLLGISLNSFVEKSVRDELKVMNG
ncbi:MAG: type II toxin-antitoxin system HicB family antitoxin [Lachnospiraceae bacterium]|nr:type II toxin-antitoxin system HicB family antitoxin [Lachnospiraceae bacterium]